MEQLEEDQEGDAGPSSTDQIVSFTDTTDEYGICVLDLYDEGGTLEFNLVEIEVRIKTRPGPAKFEVRAPLTIEPSFPHLADPQHRSIIEELVWMGWDYDAVKVDRIMLVLEQRRLNDGLERISEENREDC